MKKLLLLAGLFVVSMAGTASADDFSFRLQFGHPHRAYRHYDTHTPVYRDHHHSHYDYHRRPVVHDHHGRHVYAYEDHSWSHHDRDF